MKCEARSRRVESSDGIGAVVGNRFTEGFGEDLEGGLRCDLQQGIEQVAGSFSILQSFWVAFDALLQHLCNEFRQNPLK